MFYKVIFSVVLVTVVAQAWPAPRASNSLADKIAALSKVDEDFEDSTAWDDVNGGRSLWIK